MSNTIITQTNGIINSSSLNEAVQELILPAPLTETAREAIVSMATMQSAHGADGILKHFVKALCSTGVPLSLAEPLVFDAIAALNWNPHFRIGSEDGGDDPINYDEAMERVRKMYPVWLAKAGKGAVTSDSTGVISFLRTEPKKSSVEECEADVSSGKKDNKKDSERDVLKQWTPCADLWQSL